MRACGVLTRNSEIGAPMFCPPVNVRGRGGTPMRACGVLTRSSEIGAPMFCPPMNHIKKGSSMARI
jgi:hypothetical protein